MQRRLQVKSTTNHLQNHLAALWAFSAQLDWMDKWVYNPENSVLCCSKTVNSKDLFAKQNWMHSRQSHRCRFVPTLQWTLEFLASLKKTSLSLGRHILSRVISTITFILEMICSVCSGNTTPPNRQLALWIALWAYNYNYLIAEQSYHSLKRNCLYTHGNFKLVSCPYSFLSLKKNSEKFYSIHKPQSTISLSHCSPKHSRSMRLPFSWSKESLPWFVLVW